MKINALNNEILQKMKDDSKDKEDQAILQIKTNPRFFYKYAKQTKVTKSNIGPLKSGTKYFSGPQQMAEILSKQYDKVFTKPRTNFTTFLEKNCPKLLDIVITTEGLIEAMQSIKST